MTQQLNTISIKKIYKKKDPNNIFKNLSAYASGKVKFEKRSR